MGKVKKKLGRQHRDKGRYARAVEASPLPPHLAAHARAQAAERAKGRRVEPPAVAPGSGVDDWRDER